VWALGGGVCFLIFPWSSQFDFLGRSQPEKLSQMFDFIGAVAGAEFG
jgi:hypothetical protein